MQRNFFADAGRCLVFLDDSLLQLVFVQPPRAASKGVIDAINALVGHFSVGRAIKSYRFADLHIFLSDWKG